MFHELNFEDPKFQTIMDKTIELFYDLGIKNLSMNDISLNLKISKKTLYKYVKSKEDLIEKLFYYDELKWSNKFSNINKDKLNAIDILIQVSLLVFNELGRLNPKLKFELRKYYEPIFNQFMVRKQNHIFIQISKNITKGIGEGLYRDDVNVDLTAGLYVRNLVDMHSKDYCFSENITFGQVFEAMFENHIRAISTPVGIAFFEKRKSEIKDSNKINNN